MTDATSLADRDPDLPGFMGLVGEHPAMLRVFDLIRRVGPSTAPVLITGESGTGKELVARALHDISPRRADNLVPVHCGAIPEELLESELFGHVKGAFTGAITSRTGRFRLAHGGTIFLDEIGEMSPRFQVKLLRVLEDGTFESVGCATSQRVDARVLAATHRDLRSLAREGSFRSDLLYRLDVIPIHLVPLRERREDVPLLARHFLRRLAAKGFPPFELAPDAAAALMTYDWPGNVRELRNVLERAVLLTESAGVLRADDLPAPLSRQPLLAPLGAPASAPGAAIWPWDFGPEGTDFYLELETFERRMIGRALQIARGSKREAARLLQVNRTTLLEKLKRKGWDSEDLAGDREHGVADPSQAPPTHPDDAMVADAVAGRLAAAREWAAAGGPKQHTLFSVGRHPGPLPQQAVA
ncbi:MAG TPA: sigma-54 dependent transcriptional regulator [Candidatus Binatia bacterium]|nr:sigma-54 dependent transcriptional regulator [Candidatus Binatia bacterium]